MEVLSSGIVNHGVLTLCLFRPDYTKPLDEPSWGDSDEEEESDVEMDGDGVLDGEDEDEGEGEEGEEGDEDMEDDDLVQRVKAGKRGMLDA